MIRHDQLGSTAAGRRDAALNCGWPKCREQRLIYGAGSPDAQNDREEFRNAGEQCRDDVAAPNASLAKQVRKSG